MNYSFIIVFVDTFTRIELCVPFEYFSIGFPCLSRVISLAKRKAIKSFSVPSSHLVFRTFRVIKPLV